ncbi:hypothetical protein U8326_13465 [Tsuneonella sp. CC-YZS046]|uniref:hypothetical protein n=1 Tax=Tsuneonella sp. CC-YZS046 TaxID=3042152 RepID=UPI002D76CCC7|nr:hypothetical protein [Tsuneonella sp. CC-YZS046]WRO66040.1 hypothetical protein U8326_13465 [Tsuneonella sp. CC-YZS046]
MAMNAILRATAFLAILGAVAVPAAIASAEPAFTDYPAAETLQGTPVHPDYTGDAATYRTRIRQAVAAGPNAGGHYAIVPIGCGGSCTIVEMVDLRNGAMLAFPIGGEDYYQLALDFRLESRLIMADWKDTSDGAFNQCIRRFYEIRDGDFVALGETRRTVDDHAPCSE